MDTPKPSKPAHLLDDLEAIRELLEKDQLEPPLLTDTLDDLQIPLLSDIIEPGPAIAAPAPSAGAGSAPRPASTFAAPSLPASPPAAPAAPNIPTAAVIGTALQRNLNAPSAVEQHRLDSELRAAAQLILQDVIDDFVPQIEAELKRRLDARLDRLLKPSK
ncbi:MAG TPA: DNA polymerase III subunit chi [Pseudomonas sp.]|nr:DNA polymerase III subunit chi [Pseudomonas sp.]